MSAAVPARTRPRRLAVLAAIGAPVVGASRWLAFTAGFGAAVVAAAARPRSWRRPVRRALAEAVFEAGVAALPSVVVAALLIGIGMVFQALYWLGSVGQDALVGTVLTTVLVREVAPVVVGLLVLGRFGTATLITLGGHAREGRIAALDSQGIDPLLYLVLPRVLAAAIACLSLTILFVVFALIAGWAVALLLSPGDLGLFEFFGNVVRAMGPSNFVLLPLKGVLIGLVVATVAAALVFGAPDLAADPARLAPRGFALMVLAALVVSGLVSMVL